MVSLLIYTLHSWLVWPISRKFRDILLIFHLIRIRYSLVISQCHFCRFVDLGVYFWTFRVTDMSQKRKKKKIPSRRFTARPSAWDKSFVPNVISARRRFKAEGCSVDTPRKHRLEPTLGKRRFYALWVALLCSDRGAGLISGSENWNEETCLVAIHDFLIIYLQKKKNTRYHQWRNGFVEVIIEWNSQIWPQFKYLLKKHDYTMQNRN